MAATVHRYRATCHWEGSTLVGYEQYSRSHALTVVGPDQQLLLSADPAFHGDASALNPEQLLLAAAVSCQLLSFLAVAARARIDVLRYSDEAEADLPTDQRPTRITAIRLRPEILVAVGPSEERIRELVGIAHNECFIANSLRSEMSVEASIAYVGGGG